MNVVFKKGSYFNQQEMLFCNWNLNNNQTRKYWIDSNVVIKPVLRVIS